MATSNEKLAESLKVLKEIQDQGLVALKSSYFTRTHRERLVKHNFLEEILNGWYIVAPHDLNQ
jgi:coproporphyrinogen III oxidase-like Fe-S oxidoreductase